MLRHSQLKKKSKRELRWCQLFAVVARKIQNYHLNCPKELCRCIQEHVFTHCDRALHCEWLEHLEGVGRAHVCKKRIALEYWITSTHYNIICQRMASLSLLYNLLRLKSTHMSTTCLQNVIRKLIVGGSWSSKAPWSPGIKSGDETSGRPDQQHHHQQHQGRFRFHDQLSSVVGHIDIKGNSLLLGW